MAKPGTSNSTESSILKSVRGKRGSSVFSARDFSRYGGPAAVRKALERLVRRGALRRIRRGFYDWPRPHPLLGQTAPNAMDLVKSVMKDSSAKWQVSGAYAANLLHLSDQVPAKIVILTNGVPRKITLEKLTLDFRRAAPRHLLGAGRPAGLAIQALRHLGRAGATPGVVAKLHRQLDPATKAELTTLSPQLAAWLQPLVRQIAGTR